MVFRLEYPYILKTNYNARFQVFQLGQWTPRQKARKITARTDLHWCSLQWAVDWVNPTTRRNQNGRCDPNGRPQGQGLARLFLRDANLAPQRPKTSHSKTLFPLTTKPYATLMKARDLLESCLVRLPKKLGQRNVKVWEDDKLTNVLRKVSSCDSGDSLFCPRRNPGSSSPQNFYLPNNVMIFWRGVNKLLWLLCDLCQNLSPLLYIRKIYINLKTKILKLEYRY